MIFPTSSFPLHIACKTYSSLARVYISSRNVRVHLHVATETVQVVVGLLTLDNAVVLHVVELRVL